MNPSYQTTLALISQQHRAQLQRSLARSFPRAGEALLEDAVSDAITDAVAKPDAFLHAWEHRGEGALLGLLRHAAWCHLRGHYRRKASRCEVRLEIDLRDPQTPESVVRGRESMAKVLALVDQAAERFGGSRPQDLREALYTRLDGATDIEAARAHGVRREYVNRAKRWIGNHLDAVWTRSRRRAVTRPGSGRTPRR